MSQNGGTKILDEWADVTMTKFFHAMEKNGWCRGKGSWNGKATGDLYRSLEAGRLKTKNYGHDVFDVIAKFNQYGRFLDMGVGRGIIDYKYLDNGSYGNEQNILRRPKAWLSGIWWAETKRLKELMSEEYNSLTIGTVMSQLDVAVSGILTAHGLSHSAKDRARTARNYARRRALKGRWRSGGKTWTPYNYKQLMAMENK